MRFLTAFLVPMARYGFYSVALAAWNRGFQRLIPLNVGTQEPAVKWWQRINYTPNEIELKALSHPHPSAALPLGHANDDDSGDRTLRRRRLWGRQRGTTGSPFMGPLFARFYGLCSGLGPLHARSEMHFSSSRLESRGSSKAMMR